ncbi:hypothetical protein DFH09DRAFT_1306096 [Mycena vulgaris]|nr:hypothetical protein DFH09DRAFT_1306096 [Mycena vulgaris]
MFSIPQPPSADTECMDGYPVVKLHDDAYELEVFLEAIFDSSFFMPPPAAPKVEDIIGVLRLSHKYDVPYLRRRSLEHFGTIFPTSLSQYYTPQPNMPSTYRTMIIPLQVATEVDPHLPCLRGDFERKSSVFADMFTFPQPSSDMETMQGSPVVILHDDPAEMEVFLKAIFDSEFFIPPRRKRNSRASSESFVWLTNTTSLSCADVPSIISELCIT